MKKFFCCLTFAILLVSGSRFFDYAYASQAEGLDQEILDVQNSQFKKEVKEELIKQIKLRRQLELERKKQIETIFQADPLYVGEEVCLPQFPQNYGRIREKILLTYNGIRQGDICFSLTRLVRIKKQIISYQNDIFIQKGGSVRFGDEWKYKIVITSATPEKASLKVVFDEDEKR